MPVVRCISIYLGKSPAAKQAKPGQNLMLEDNGALCQLFHKAFLESQDAARRFQVHVALPELPPVDVHWAWTSQTAGLALWQRGGRIGAASILLNGLEADQDRMALAAATGEHRLPIPSHVWQTLAREPKPVVANLFCDLASFTDPVIGTAAPAMGNAFFTLFGTNET